MSLLPKLARQDVFLFLLPGPIRQNHTLKGQMTSSRDLFENHTIFIKVIWVKFLPVWDWFFGDDIESEFLFDFSCFFTSNLTQVFVKKFVDLGLIWSAKKCSKLNYYFVLIFNFILLILKRCQKLRFYRFYLEHILNIPKNIFKTV